MDDTALATFERLLPQLGWATAVIMVCVAIHGFGLALLTWALHPADEDKRGTHLPPLSPRGILAMLGVVYALVILHGIEIWLFALFFHTVGAQPNLETSVYYSIISYGAIGYDDVAVASNWRVVGALEGICGIIMLGWSTAWFVRMLARIDFAEK